MEAAGVGGVTGDCAFGIDVPDICCDTCVLSVFG